MLRKLIEDAREKSVSQNFRAVMLNREEKGVVLSPTPFLGTWDNVLRYFLIVTTGGESDAGTWWLKKGRDMAKHLRMHRTAPTPNKEQDVNRGGEETIV